MLECRDCGFIGSVEEFTLIGEFLCPHCWQDHVRPHEEECYVVEDYQRS